MGDIPGACGPIIYAPPMGGLIGPFIIGLKPPCMPPPIYPIGMLFMPWWLPSAWAAPMIMPPAGKPWCIWWWTVAIYCPEWVPTPPIILCIILPPCCIGIIPYWPPCINPPPCLWGVCIPWLFWKLFIAYLLAADFRDFYCFYRFSSSNLALLLTRCFIATFDFLERFLFIR